MSDGAHLTSSGAAEESPRRRVAARPEPGSEAETVAALCRGDEAAFLALVQRYHGLMCRLARPYVGSLAEEVVQETWLAVLTGIQRFEQRSTLKTWLFKILINRARSRAEYERRSVPFSALEPDLEGDEPAVEPERFLPFDHPRWPGHWAIPPRRWEQPEERVLRSEILHHVRRAIDGLPLRQREVILLRDVAGWSSEDVCEALGLSEGNQRVLLHRARSKVRRVLEDRLGTEAVG